MKAPDDFVREILHTRQAKAADHNAYGSRVMPAIEIYKSLSTFEERKAFQDALEEMLRSDDAEIRRFAVDICLGFFVFRDAI